MKRLLEIWVLALVMLSFLVAGVALAQPYPGKSAEALQLTTGVLSASGTRITTSQPIQVGRAAKIGLGLNMGNAIASFNTSVTVLHSNSQSGPFVKASGTSVGAGTTFHEQFNITGNQDFTDIIVEPSEYIELQFYQMTGTVTPAFSFIAPGYGPSGH